jgi:anti-sigma factor RsiW
MPDRREHEEALPFLVNGTLDAGEREALERALAEDPGLAAERVFLAAVRDAVREEVGAADPGDWPLRRALRTIEREQRQTRRVHPVWRVLAVAASLAVLVQAGVLVQQTFGPASGMRPLGGPEAVRTADRAVLQIAFAAGVSEAAVRALLAEARATIVEGPSAAGLYRVALRDVAAGDRAGAERARAALAARSDVVAHVAVE